MAKRARGNGGVFQVKGSRFWWISYQLNGKTVRESSGELTKTAAANKLKDHWKFPRAAHREGYC
jgi:hypothetical protein